MLGNITVNNVSYDWNDIEIHFSLIDYDPIGVSSINYSTNHQIDYEYSRTGFAVGRKYGKYQCSGSITLDYYELTQLRRDVVGIFNAAVPIDVKVIYKKDNATFIDTLYGCVLSYPDSGGGNQGEANLEATIQLNPVWIKYGNV